MRRVLWIVVAVIVAALIYVAYTVLGVRNGWFGELEDVGTITGLERSDVELASRVEVQLASATQVGVTAPKQILFGDLHVHSTYSTDAFLWSLPMMQGEGAHPISDACDYARHCSALDFWGISDHAEASTPRKWQTTLDAVRQCNAIAADPSNPDMVTFMGFEWTQVGRLPDEHYGHKNVFFEGLGDEDISARPIAAAGGALDALRNNDLMPAGTAYADWSNRQRYFDFSAFTTEVRSIPLCEPGVASNLLPSECTEVATTPADLTRKLDEQDLDYLLIPHGTSWGFYTPPGTTFDKQLTLEMRPETQEIIEVYSGHGASEEYRPWRAVEAIGEGLDAVASCPQPSANYLPSCWRAGEIIEMRCLEEGGDVSDCAARAAVTREDAANMSVAFHLTVRGESSEDWLDSGQCTDCFLPAFNFRPTTSMQYGLAISSFERGPNDPTRFYWGVIASSDNHRARPGTGYKEFDRRRSTEMGGPRSEAWRDRMLPPDGEAPAESRPVSQEYLMNNAGFGLLEAERQNSFWLSGGLAAVHTEGRSREEIWDALKRRETYGTSGPRILLWFDRIEGDDRAPMGSQDQLGTTPTFEVRAVGAFKQRPGCPETTTGLLDASRIEQLCAGECYNPSDERHLITRIEVVRIRPQSFEGESVDGLIEDAWQVLECPPDPRGCTVQFSDPDYVETARDTTYYVRAIQEPTEAINADPLECERDETGRCISVNMCYGDFRSDWDDECLDPVEERAWSSPIYLQWTN